ncbi:MAG TPA: CAP domain-containing protein [Ktedonobacteraceae bacterium]|nr:CAP domain-containing protein [Ktedonobacteraceae bacterium]
MSTPNRLNRIAASWMASICLAILLLVVSACSTTISAPATPTQTSTGAASTTTKENQIAQTVFQAINKSRADNKLPPLKWSNALASSARQHNTAMQAANTLSHQLPGEPDLGAREHQQGVNWIWAAENIGETTEQSVNGALALHTAMMNERPPDNGHRLNILTTTGTMVGVAILLDQQNGKLWLTEDFAKV